MQNPTQPDSLPAEIASNTHQSSERVIEIDDGDHEWIITLRTSIDPSVEHWVSVAKNELVNEIDNAKTRRLIIDISLAHPFSSKYIGAHNENIELFLRVA